MIYGRVCTTYTSCDFNPGPFVPLDGGLELIISLSCLTMSYKSEHEVNKLLPTSGVSGQSASFEFVVGALIGILLGQTKWN
jgi:hypothetical protein